MSLANQTVVVLGGSSGIGLATATAACAEGAHVIITGRSPERLAVAAATFDAEIRTVVLDVNDEPGTAALFADLSDVDHVFITAGALVLDAQLAPASDALRPALDTRFWGALFAAKYAAGKIRAGGSITFMSGTAGMRPLPGASVGSASCGAVDALARALALDLAPVRVNSIAPGYVDTPLLDGLLGDQRDAVLAEAAARLPAKRIGRPQEIADGVMFMMKNEYVTGITLVIDGGGLLV